MSFLIVAGVFLAVGAMLDWIARRLRGEHGKDVGLVRLTLAGIVETVGLVIVLCTLVLVFDDLARGFM